MCCLLFFQAEDGIRDLVRSRGLGDVYKRQALHTVLTGERHGYYEDFGELEQLAQAYRRPFVYALSLIHI